ncbi:hypothetical protein ACFE04_030313 [Oxalis oulophora]
MAMVVARPIYSPGLRFCPSNYELVSHYLVKFLVNPEKDLDPSWSHIMKKYDIYTLEPWTLPLDSGSHLIANETYFFTPRHKLSKNSTRPKRTVEVKVDDNNLDKNRGGYWRSSATKKPILDRETGEIVAYLNNFCFYRNATRKRSRKESVEKTDWLMDEYELNKPTFQDWVLCRIKFNGIPNYDVPYGHYKTVSEQDLHAVNDNDNDKINEDEGQNNNMMMITNQRLGDGNYNESLSFDVSDMILLENETTDDDKFLNELIIKHS